MLSDRAVKFRSNWWATLYRAGGLSWERYLRQYPQPRSFYFEFIRSPIVGGWGDKVDDDCDLRVNNKSIRNAFRNLSISIQKFSYSGEMKIGDRVEIYTVDTHPSTYTLRPWKMSIVYEDDSTRVITGGKFEIGSSDVARPSPLPPGYFQGPPKILKFYRNGSFNIPQPTRYPNIESFDYTVGI